VTDVFATRFSLDSSLDLPADGYTVEVGGTELFRNANDADTVALESGYVDGGTGIAYRVGNVSGKIDEYEITVTPAEMRCRVLGRDNMAEMIGRRYQKLYLRAQPTPEERTKYEEAGTAYAVGTFRASEIAREIAQAAGLTLSWECRDYTLLEDFDATGRGLDIIRRLLEPWNLVPMFGVDFHVYGTTMICRPRPVPPVAEAMNTFAIKDARIKSLTIRKRRATRYGKVTLFGKLVPKTGGTGGTVVQPYEYDEVSTSETKDERGAVIQRVVRTTTYLMPVRIVLRSREQTYDKQGGVLKLVRDEFRENEWEAVRYDDRGSLNQPRQLFQSVNVQGIHQSDKAKRFQPIRKETTSFAYETDGYQDMTTNRKWEINLKKSQMEETERITRTLREVSHLEVEEVTSVYKRGKTGEFYLFSQDTNKSAGLRPAGPRPSRTIVVGGGPSAPTDPLKLEATISTQVWAEDVTYTNRNLEQEDLDYLMGCFEAASGLWEYEISMSYLAMPWIRKGNHIALTGLLAEDGVTAIPLPTCLVVGQTLNYDENPEAPSMVSNLTAMAWSAA
jgi:hypothetical protein